MRGDVRAGRDEDGPVATLSSDRPGAGDDRPPLREEVLRERLLAPAGPLAHLTLVQRAGSTNSDLAAAVRDDAAVRTGVALLVTEHQVDGRGRSGRSWQTPPAAALTFSLALRPAAPSQTWGWLPLLVGLGVVRAITGVTGVTAGVKWPNDLIVDVPGAREIEGWGTERKLGGILVELVTAPSGPVAVVGVGLNVSQRADELPVPTAQSLTGVGAHAVDREALLVACVTGVTGLVDRWDAADGDARAVGCRRRGRRGVHDPRPDGPGRAARRRTARGRGDRSRARRRPAGAGADGQVRAVRAGDVRHLRSTGGATAG